MNELVMHFPQSPRPDSAGMASAVRGLISGGGSITTDQVQAWLTAMIQQIGGTLADALKRMKTGKDQNNFSFVVKIKVQQFKED